MRNVVVVGASAAGLSTVEALRLQGYDGSVTLIGAESHPPYDRPPLSKQVLTGTWEPGRLILRTKRELAAQRIDVRLGVVATGLNLTDREVTLADGSRVGYDALVIATGVRPRRLPLPGADRLSGVHVLRTLEDALALRDRLRPRRRLVIGGAGFVGTEAAAVARKLGVEVTVVEPAAVPLAHAVGDRVGRFLTDLHLHNGVDLRTGTAVTEILGTGRHVTGVQLTDGSVVPADDVLMAVGSTPGTGWLASSGLSIEDGVVCDQYCKAARHVYAAGDVARWYNPLFGTSMRVEHRTNAAEQGRAVAYNLLNPYAGRAFAPVPYFWSDQYGLRIQSYGYLRGHDEHAIVDGSPAEGRFLVAYRAGEYLTGVLGIGASPKTLRAWRTAIADRTPWAAAIPALRVAG
ncbi:NAD(P)/FAD-dependent oxidoreductase [Streptomyces sp. NPDC002143]